MFGEIEKRCVRVYYSLNKINIRNEVKIIENLRWGWRSNKEIKKLLI